MAKETKKKSLYVVGDDNGNIAGVDAGGTCENEPVFNRMSKKKVTVPCSFLAKALWAFAKNAYFKSIYHQCASACT